MTIIRKATIGAKKYLTGDEILLFIGARQVGKTTILKQLQQHLERINEPVYFLNLEDPDYLSLLNQSPKNLLKIFPLNLERRNFIFIDEVQYLNNPSNFLKYFFDEYQGKIKLLVSGSSAFYLDKKFRDSLAGRKKIFIVRTLSFGEFLHFKNEEKLSRKNLANLSLSEKEKIALYFREFMMYGGYPRVVLSHLEEKTEVLRDITYSYIKKDIFDANIKQDEIFYKLLKILSSQIGNLVNSSELASTLGVSKSAIDNYLYVMQKSFHIFLLKPFFKNVRKELIKMPKVYFYDLGLRNFLVDNFRSFETRDDRGALLENAVLRLLLEKHDEETIRFWRTVQKNEVDFIIGEKKAFEIKTNPLQFREKDYQIFLKNYPEITLSIVSLEKKGVSSDQYQVLDAWEI